MASDEKFQAKVSAFIAKKADMLFKRNSETSNPAALMAGSDKTEEGMFSVPSLICACCQGLPWGFANLTEWLL